MIRATIVVREIGRSKPEYSLEFDLPVAPVIGDYISIHRPDKEQPYGEDLIVRRKWWRLEHPETAATTTGTPKVGSFGELMIECDQALGPYASDQWRELMESAKKRGAHIEVFDIERFSVREQER